jgi:hypothetical protein
MDRGDRGECRCVLTKDGDELEWPDLEVASGSVPDADGRRHPGHSRGQRCSDVGERQQCWLVLAELAVGAACSGRAPGWRIERQPTGTLLWLGRRLRCAVREERAGGDWCEP